VTSPSTCDLHYLQRGACVISLLHVSLCLCTATPNCLALKQTGGYQREVSISRIRLTRIQKRLCNFHLTSLHVSKCAQAHLWARMGGRCRPRRGCRTRTCGFTEARSTTAPWPSSAQPSAPSPAPTSRVQLNHKVFTHMFTLLCAPPSAMHRALLLRGCRLQRLPRHHVRCLHRVPLLLRLEACMASLLSMMRNRLQAGGDCQRIGVNDFHDDVNYLVTAEIRHTQYILCLQAGGDRQRVRCGRLPRRRQLHAHSVRHRGVARPRHVRAIRAPGEPPSLLHDTLQVMTPPVLCSHAEPVPARQTGLKYAPGKSCAVHF